MNATQLDLLAPIPASPKAPTMTQASALYKMYAVKSKYLKTFAERFRWAIESYTERYGVPPERALVNGGDAQDVDDIDGVSISIGPLVSTNEVWMEVPQSA